jgi:hypothetical protein
LITPIINTGTGQFIFDGCETIVHAENIVEERENDRRSRITATENR